MAIKESIGVSLAVFEDYFLSKPRTHHCGRGRAGYTGIKLQGSEKKAWEPAYLPQAMSVIIPITILIRRRKQ